MPSEDLPTRRGRPGFPLVSLAACFGIVGLSLAAGHVAGEHCAFGFGGFQCNGWAGRISGLLWAWGLASLVLIPLSSAVALWRLLRWGGDRYRQSR